MSEQSSTDRLKDVAKDCVHCGFCLPACPTYQLWGEEMDSPRGRIHLVSQILDGAPLTPATATHFDRCLGCMACMTACPSGVQFDQLIEAARGWTEHPRQAPAGPADAPADAWTDASTGVAVPAPLARRPLRDRATRAAIFAVFPYPARLRLLTAPLRMAQRTGLDKWLAGSGLPAKVSPAAEAALRLAPPSGVRPAASGPRSARDAGAAGARWAWKRVRKGTAARPAAQRLPERVAARGQRRAVVGMLTGCVQSVFFPQVNAATARVLAAEGCDVIIPRGQGCCGALSGHSGRPAEAMRFARATIETFERAGVDAIVVNSAGCGSAMKDYQRLLADDLTGGHGSQPGGASPPEAAPWAARAAALSGRVRDLSEFLSELGPVAPRHPVPVTAAYHDACHLGHAQRITRQPRELLAAIPELRLVELPDAGTCCGSAGVYNLLQPQAARELAARKADSVLASGADLVISANPGCTLQISAELSQRGKRIATAHTAEILDMSINRRT